MGADDAGLVALGQFLVQLLARRAVQVVGRLVQNQDARAAKAQPGQHQAHGFATAQGTAGSVERQMGQAKPRQASLNVPGQVPAIVEQVEQCRVAGAGLDPRQGFQGCAHPQQVGDGAADRRQPLRQVARAAGVLHAALAGRQTSRHEACQHRLAAAVGADDAGELAAEGRIQA
ncbi:MAG: hypothetical protein K0S77_3933 [Pseudomonas sp.]|nr:hypothetical protein [Pseudomonas sp.]